MKSPVASLFLTVSLLSAIALGQSTNQTVNKNRERGKSRSATLKICQGVPIPDGYVIVAYETASACPHGAYVLKKQNTEAQVSGCDLSRRSRVFAFADSSHTAAPG